jgi:hypothetical protein
MRSATKNHTSVADNCDRMVHRCGGILKRLQDIGTARRSGAAPSGASVAQ